LISSSGKGASFDERRLAALAEQREERIKTRLNVAVSATENPLRPGAKPIEAR